MKIKRNEIRKLIVLKATVGEKYLHPKNEVMQSLVTSLFALTETSKNDLGVNKQNYTLLNNFFLKTLDETVDN